MGEEKQICCGFAFHIGENPLVPPVSLSVALGGSQEPSLSLTPSAAQHWPLPLAGYQLVLSEVKRV